MSAENNGNENKPTNHGLWKVSLHQLTIGGTSNYERQQSTGFTETMMPVIEEYYEDPEEKRETYARHIEYFLTNDITSAIPAGVATAVEERYAMEGDVDPDSVNAVKTVLMGPLAGLGDSLLNSTAGSILAGIVISFTTAGLGQIRPIFSAIGMSTMLLGAKYLEVFQGYEQGVRFAEKIQSSGLVNRISKLTAIAVYVIVGGLIPAFTVISIPIVYQSDNTVLSIQKTLDGLMPGILEMLYTGLTYLLVSKKKISAVELILVTMIVSIVGTYCSILG